MPILNLFQRKVWNSAERLWPYAIFTRLWWACCVEVLRSWISRIWGDVSFKSSNDKDFKCNNKSLCCYRYLIYMIVRFLILTLLPLLVYLVLHLLCLHQVAGTGSYIRRKWYADTSPSPSSSTDSSQVRAPFPHPPYSTISEFGAVLCRCACSATYSE